MLTDQEKKERREARKAEREAKKEASRIENEKNQKPVKELTITIEWKRSRTWGSNPNATAAVEYIDGHYERREGYRCSGCGYDKESTVIASIFNDFMKYKLWNLGLKNIRGGHGSGDNGPAPYGIHIYSDTHPGYSGGIETNCYYRIAEFIGGKFEHIASGKTFDVYRYTDN